MIKVRISEDAFSDLDDGYWFYESQEEGLGEYFATTLRADIEDGFGAIWTNNGDVSPIRRHATQLALAHAIRCATRSRA
jgi:hypothetical protein